MFRLLLVLGCLASISQIECLTEGSCAKNPIIKDFDISKYAGQWYEVQRQKVFFENDLACIKATYNVLNSTSATVYNEALNLKTDTPNVRSGIAYVPDLSAPNLLLVDFPGNEKAGIYNVWDSDYVTYSLVYSCTQIIPKILKEEFVWILSREKTLDDRTIANLKKLLNANGVRTKDFVKTIQTDCI